MTMWIGEKIAGSTRPREDSTAADLGITTIGGASAAVETRGEDRAVPVYGPGGYFWQPKAGERVLVIKGGVAGGEQCVAAAEQGEAPEGMEPGDVCIRAGEASLYLRSDGRIDLTGALYINGAIYKPCECESPVPVG